MYNPSVEEIVSVLIESAMEYAMESVDSDLDNSVFDEHIQLEESLNSVLVEGVIKTPVEKRLLPPLTKVVNIKVMKIMRDHNIPLVAERELYQWAIKLERLAGFT